MSEAASSKLNRVVPSNVWNGDINDTYNSLLYDSAFNKALKDSKIYKCDVSIWALQYQYFDTSGNIQQYLVFTLVYEINEDNYAAAREVTNAALHSEDFMIKNLRREVTTDGTLPALAHTTRIATIPKTWRKPPQKRKKTA